MFGAANDNTLQVGDEVCLPGTGEIRSWMKPLLVPLGALALRACGYHMGCPATPQVGREGL